MNEAKVLFETNPFKLFWKFAFDGLSEVVKERMKYFLCDEEKLTIIMAYKTVFFMIFFYITSISIAMLWQSSSKLRNKNSTWKNLLTKLSLWVKRSSWMQKKKSCTQMQLATSFGFVLKFRIEWKVDFPRLFTPMHYSLALAQR